MKHFFTPIAFKIKSIASLILLVLLIPMTSFGQKKEISLTVDCVEAIGNGRYIVSFGYDNTNSETVDIDETSSVVTYNRGQSKKYGANTFLPGVHEKAFSQEFSNEDRVVWEVIMPNGKTKIVSADINSNHCNDVLDIIPYYAPPAGGKVDRYSLIGAELTSLYNKYIADEQGPGFNEKSDNIFQLRVVEGEPQIYKHQVYIEAVPAGFTDDLLTSLQTYGFEEDPVGKRAR